MPHLKKSRLPVTSLCARSSRFKCDLSKKVHFNTVNIHKNLQNISHWKNMGFRLNSSPTPSLGKINPLRLYHD